MAAERPSYILAPNWDFPPDGAIALGSLIVDPKRPDRALSRTTVDPSLVTTTKRTGWCFTRGDVHSGHVGIWDVVTGASHNSNVAYRCNELETRYFEPGDAFVASSLNTSAVKAYTKSKWWRSIYMITGIKIAYESTMESETERGHSVEGKIGAGGTSAGAPIGGGSKAQYEQKKRRMVKCGASEGFVLAFQLLRIKPKKDGAFKAGEFNKFALLGEDDDLESLERQQALEHLHETWEIEQLKQPTDDEEWEDVELTPADDLDCNIFAGRPQLD